MNEKSLRARTDDIFFQAKVQRAMLCQLTADKMGCRTAVFGRSVYTYDAWNSHIDGSGEEIRPSVVELRP